MSYPANHTPSPNDGVDGLLYQIADSVGAIVQENDTPEVKLSKIAIALEAASEGSTAVLYSEQTLTADQQAQARTNIGSSPTLFTGVADSGRLSVTGSKRGDFYSSTGQAEIFTVVCTDAAVDGSYILVGGGAYYFWTNLDSGGNDPAPGGAGFPVVVVTGYTAGDYATALAESINDASVGITAVAVGATVTCTYDNAGAREDAADNDTGFAVTVTQQGVSLGNTFVLVGDDATATEDWNVLCVGSQWDVELRMAANVPLSGSWAYDDLGMVFHSGHADWIDTNGDIVVPSTGVYAFQYVIAYGSAEIGVYSLAFGLASDYGINIALERSYQPENPMNVGGATVTLVQGQRYRLYSRLSVSPVATIAEAVAGDGNPSFLTITKIK